MAVAIRDVTPQDADLMNAVLALWRPHRQRLGFLPNAAFLDRARGSTLAVAISPDSPRAITGYVLYDLVRDVVKIIHVCVDPRVRNQGVARALIDYVCEKHRYRRAAQLACRRDYGLERFWESLGFTAMSERPGKNFKGELLTHWQRSFGHNTLFDLRSNDRPQFAIDTNVLMDLHSNRSSSSATREGFPDWLSDELELVISEETLNDINRIADDALRRALRSAADDYVRLRRTSAAIERTVKELEEALSRLGRSSPGSSDLRQLAAAIHAGIKSFVTSDHDFREAVGDVAYEKFAISMIAPADVVARFDELNGSATFDPVGIANTDFSWRPVRANEFDRISSTFIAKDHGETAASFRAIWRTARGRQADLLCIEESNGTLLAVIARVSSGKWVDIPILRTANSSHGRTLAQYILYSERISASRNGLTGVRLLDPVARRLSEALDATGYMRSGSEWLATCVSIVARTNLEALRALRRHPLIAKGNLQSRRLARRLALAEPLSAAEAGQVETALLPLRIMDAHITNLLVPIKPQFAEQLFDIELAKQKLFKGPHGLGTQPEQVYYRSPGFPSTFSQPARILWYVSAERSRPGTKAVRACSLLDHVDEDSPEELYRRYRRLGVFALDDVRRASKRGRATAMVFRNTELFDRPIDLDQLRSIAAAAGHPLVFQSASSIPSGMYAQIYMAGFA